MAISYVGKSTFAVSTGGTTITIPAIYEAGDLLVLIKASANQTLVIPSGWTEVANSPQYTGAAASLGGIRVAVFYKIAISSEPEVFIADSGNVTSGSISVWRGVDTSSPINVTAGSVDASATSSLSCPTVITTVNNCMIINAIGLDKDATQKNTLSSFSNASLASITRGEDSVSAQGLGVGIAFFYGVKGTAGTVSSTTATGDTSTTHAYITLALTPIADEIEEYSGSSSIDQSSTLEALGNTQRFGSCEISQASTIVVTGEKYESVGVSGSAEITQSSTVQATGFKSVSDSSQVSQESTLSASATSNRLGQSSITNESTVLATGEKSISDHVEISQGSTIQSLGFKSVSAQASISQGSIVYAIGVKYVAPEEHSGSCAISQDSTVETSSYKGGKGSVSVANESTVVVTGSKATSPTGLVSQVYTIVGLGYKTANGQASISQGSTVKASRNAKFTKKYGNVIQFDKTQKTTVQPVNHGIVVQMNKDTEGEIKLNAPFRKDVEL